MNCRSLYWVLPASFIWQPVQPAQPAQPVQPVQPAAADRAAPPIKRGTLSGAPLLALRKAGAADKRPLRLRVAYSQVELGGKTGFVRTYDGQLVGPTLRVRPGDTLRVDLENDLPNDPGDPAGHGHHKAPAGAAAPDINIPHGFNTTNLHTHGLHVRPDYPSRCKGKARARCTAVADNVLVAVPPGGRQRYEIEVPRDHPPGTYWYHAHNHGSVAIQLASGMAGLLVVEGGLDDVPEIKRATEVPLVFQQLRLTDCGRQAVGAGQGPERCKLTDAQSGATTYYESCDAFFQRLVDAKVLADAPKGAWCVENFTFVFGVQRLAQVLAPLFGYHTAINGRVGPDIVLRAGELQRWRTVHAGVMEGLQLGLVARADESSQLGGDALTGAAAKRVKFHAIAYDGLATGRLDEVDHMELQPGYRADLLVRIDQPGDYLLIDIPTSAPKSLLAAPEPYTVLASVTVTPSDQPPMPLPGEAALAPLAPFKHVEDREIDGCQYATFNFGNTGGATPRTSFLINGGEYDPAEPPRSMPVGSAEEWVLNSQLANHPFHIHVNAFELQEDYGGFKKGTWKDTLLVNQDAPARVRTRYEDFTGTFVMHCHILNHEDQGMMETIEVLPPGKKGSGCPTQGGACLSPPPVDGLCARPPAP